jgi:hypothetical protein
MILLLLIGVVFSIINMAFGISHGNLSEIIGWFLVALFGIKEIAILYKPYQ